MSASDDLSRALAAVGFDAADPEMARTPDLVTSMWREFVPGSRLQRAMVQQQQK